MKFLIQWLINALAVGITAYLLPGVRVSGIFAALITALLLGLVNVFIRPLLLILTLPLNILTLGLFTLVINALMVLLVAAIVPGFSVRGFWWAFLFGLVLAIVNYVLNVIF